jgi:hypothetical protein
MTATTIHLNRAISDIANFQTPLQLRVVSDFELEHVGPFGSLGLERGRDATTFFRNGLRD